MAATANAHDARATTRTAADRTVLVVAPVLAVALVLAVAALDHSQHRHHHHYHHVHTTKMTTDDIDAQCHSQH